MDLTKLHVIEFKLVLMGAEWICIDIKIILHKIEREKSFYILINFMNAD